MNNCAIRVVTGPANYLSHVGSLSRLTDFSRRNSFPTLCGCTENVRLSPPGLTCREHLSMLVQNIYGLPVIVANVMLSNWRMTPAMIDR